MSEHDHPIAVAPAHAPLAPSSAHRWIHCPGSVALSAEQPDIETDFAKEGTMLHEIIAKLVTDGVRSDDFDEIRRPGWTEDQVIEYTQLMRDCLRCFWARYRDGDIVIVERRVYFPDDDEIWGTSDVILIGSNRIETIDWKFGRGVEVDAIDNEQLLIYLLAAYFTFDFLGMIEQLIATVCQPRLGPPKEWHIPAKEAHRRRNEILRAAARTRTDNELNDGDWCRFCPAKADCPKLRETALSVAQAGFDVLDAAAQIDDTELARILTLVPRVESWLKAIKAEAMIRLNDGKPVPGFKLVEGRRGNRRWNDTEEVVHARTRWINSNVGMQAYETKLKGIAQIEKIAGKGKIPAHFWEQPQGKLHVAPESDKRISVVGAQLAFDVLEDEDG